MRHEGLLFKNPDTASDSPTREEAKAKGTMVRKA